MYDRYSPAGGVVPSSYNKAFSTDGLGHLTIFHSQAIIYHNQINAQPSAPTAKDLLLLLLLLLIIIIIIIFINCNWVVTRWQYTFTHEHYIEQHK
jgi:hypothetical protein